MTQRARRASLLVALSLLTSAATANAECAWVMWSSWQGAEHTVSSTHEDRVGCIQAIRRNLLRWGAGTYAAGSTPVPGGSTPGIDLSGLAEGKGQFWMTSRDGKVGLGEYVCLPDTVDPRGRK